MAERKQTTAPEAEKTQKTLELSDAIKGITSLIHTEDELEAGQDAQDDWTQMTEDYPAFDKKIGELRDRMRVVAETKNRKHKYSSSRYSSYSHPFLKIENIEARKFLTKILFSRRLPFQKEDEYNIEKIDYQENNYKKEAKKMAEEMELTEEIGLTNVTLEQVVRSILVGKLKIAYQPK